MSWVRVPSPTPYDLKAEGPERPLRPFPFERRRIGVSPSGKARDFDSRIRWFESSHPSQSFRRLAGFPIFPICDSVAQLAEQLPFKQWVRGSNPRWVTIKTKQYRCHWRKASGINCFRAFSARKFTDDSIDANHCFHLTGGIRTPSSQWLANPKPCGALLKQQLSKRALFFYQSNTQSLGRRFVGRDGPLLIIEVGCIDISHQSHPVSILFIIYLS